MVEAAKPPRHLLLGTQALTRFRKRLEDWTAELDAWEATTLGADFPDDHAEHAGAPLETVKVGGR